MLIATIAKRFTFDAAHRLDNLPVDHKCHRMHGHTYEVELEFAGPVKTVGPQRGFVLDYQVIADAWEPIHELLDHRVLNDVPGLEVPTTEYLATWIVIRLAELPMLQSFSNLGTLLTAVTVKESSTTWCRVTVGAVHRAGHLMAPPLVQV